MASLDASGTLLDSCQALYVSRRCHGGVDVHGAGVWGCGADIQGWLSRIFTWPMTSDRFSRCTQQGESDPLRIDQADGRLFQSRLNMLNDRGLFSRCPVCAGSGGVPE